MAKSSPYMCSVQPVLRGKTQRLQLMQPRFYNKEINIETLISGSLGSIR